MAFTFFRIRSILYNFIAEKNSVFYCVACVASLKIGGGKRL